MKNLEISVKNLEFVIKFPSSMDSHQRTNLLSSISENLYAHHDLEKVHKSHPAGCPIWFRTMAGAALVEAI